MRTTAKIAAVLAAAAVLVAAAVVLRAGADGREPSLMDGERLVVGVATRMPERGPGSWPGVRNARFDGFDTDVATYLAGRLGFGRDRVAFRHSTRDGWERDLAAGTVDIVVGAYPIAPEGRRRATYAGPYHVVHEDLLVRAGDETIRNVRDLRGKRLCQVTGGPGAGAARQVVEGLGIAATPVPAGTYRDCVEALTRNRVDAVTGDDVLLARLAATTGDGGAVPLNAPFAAERQGIGLREGDVRACLAVNRHITEMYQSGAAETLLQEWYGTARLDVTTTVPAFEGC
ncbi:transporter substrate-binding domain-containing protein [Spirillospora sp. NPDC029432]|uniref:transporter substrate-binding domain-containing protein n=1 Tax=Spirillospora sp. NPDC029432 TaxID=3154599 RepID=UPI003454D4A6